jgi:hypothetical protein
MRFWLCFIIFLLGCSPSFSGAPIRHTVHLDPTFSPIETAVIKTGLREWTTATQERVVWNYDDFPNYETSTELHFADENRHILIRRALSTYPDVLSAEIRLKTRAYGFWIKGKDYEFITLVMDRITTTRELRLTTEHEIGHVLLGMEHQPHTLMEAVGFDIEGITPTDLQRFCRMWGCL